MISVAPPRPGSLKTAQPAATPAAPRTETPAAARLRRGTVWSYAAAVVTMPVAVFWEPALGDEGMILVLLLSGGLIACAGFALLVFAAVRKTARDAAVPLAAILALAGSLALLPAAGTAGAEAALDRRAARLEALVPELVAAPPEVRAVLSGERAEWDPGLTEEQRVTVQRLRQELRPLAVYSVRVEPGYVLFGASAAFAPDALYVTGAGVPATVDRCARPDLRFAGGRWYLYRCADSSD